MARTKQPERRPVNLAALEGLVARMKLRAGIELPGDSARNVSVPRESFMPVVQANVGSPPPISVFRYRLLVPTAEAIRESPPSFRRITVATADDVELTNGPPRRPFGGAPLPHQQNDPAVGTG